MANAVSPTEALADRDAYYPGTETLAPDEMRVTVCGTGRPNACPKQAAACFLVELGNGDKFIFNIGTGSWDDAPLLFKKQFKTKAQPQNEAKLCFDKFWINFVGSILCKEGFTSSGARGIITSELNF